MDHPLTRTLDQVLMEFTIVWKLIAYTPSSRNVRENLALFYSHNILLLCHKSKVFPSISCPYFPRWHPLAMVTCMCQPSISWSPPSVCLSYWTICVVSYRFLSPLLSRDFQLIACLLSFAVGCRMSLLQDWWNTKATQSKDFFQEIRK